MDGYFCSLDGCNKPTRDRCKTGTCEVHYYRMRRTGTYDLKPHIKKSRYIQSGGYVRLLLNHPLSDSTGYVYEHRQVAYDAGVELKCYLCGKVHNWDSCHVDHIDNDKQNNTLSNLRIACPVCNQSRGRFKSSVMQKNSGKLLTLDGELFMCKADWARKLNISAAGLKYRLSNWSKFDALTIEKGVTGPKTNKIRTTSKIVEFTHDE